MKTPHNIKALALSVGAAFEEDTASSELRCFQLVAPPGHLWADGQPLHLRVDWARRSDRSSVDYNTSVFADLERRVACGYVVDPSGDDERDPVRCCCCSEDFPLSLKPLSSRWQMGVMRPLMSAPRKIRIRFADRIESELLGIGWLCGNCFFDLTD